MFYAVLSGESAGMYPESDLPETKRKKYASVRISDLRVQCLAAGQCRDCDYNPAAPVLIQN